METEGVVVRPDPGPCAAQRAPVPLVGLDDLDRDFYRSDGSSVRRPMQGVRVVRPTHGPWSVATPSRWSVIVHCRM